MLYKFLSNKSENNRDFETLKRENFFASSYESLNDSWDKPKKFIEKDFLKKLPKAAKKLSIKFLKEINAQGLYCLSTTKSSSLMWAHYADDWKGLCIEYSHNEKDFFNELRKTHGESIVRGALKMSYAPFPIILTVDDIKEKKYEEAIQTLFGQKHEDWKYEKEFRIIFNKTGLLHIPSSMISKIYLGHAMSKENKEKYLELFTSKNIAVFEAKPDGNNFSGDICVEPLNSLAIKETSSFAQAQMMRQA